MGNSFFERYSELCKSAGKTPNSVAKAIGASSGSVTAWKNGTEPRYSTIAKIAEYFNISVDYLSGHASTEKAPAVTSKRSVSDDDIMFALWGDADDMSQDDLDDVKRYAAFVRERKRNK